MRTILFLPMILLGACAANLPEPGERLVARIAYGDLALDEPGGRMQLRQRIDTAAAAYCRKHSDDVTPQLIRTETSYCVDTIRFSILAEMPRDMRRAYAQGSGEAPR